MTRDEIRKAVRAKRQAVSGIQVAELSLRICERVVALPEFIAARRVLCYAALPEEVQTRSLLWAIRRSGKELYLPVVRPNCHMDAVRVTDETVFVPDRMGIESPQSGEILPPEQLDLVLTPGIAFDRLGNRLGFGKGHFDRFLVDCRAFAIGLAYELQIVDRIEKHVHDIPMHKIVTESNVYDCAKARRALIETGV